MVIKRRFKILDYEVCIYESCDSLLKCNHKTKTIEASTDFVFFNTKQQEFLVKVVTSIDSMIYGEVLRYSTADEEAFDFITNRYPEEKKSYWTSTFIDALGKSKNGLSELNRQRVSLWNTMILRSNNL